MTFARIFLSLRLTCSTGRTLASSQTIFPATNGVQAAAASAPTIGRQPTMSTTQSMTPSGRPSPPASISCPEQIRYVPAAIRLFRTSSVLTRSRIRDAWGCLTLNAFMVHP